MNCQGFCTLLILIDLLCAVHSFVIASVWKPLEFILSLIVLHLGRTTAEIQFLPPRAGLSISFRLCCRGPIPLPRPLVLADPGYRATQRIFPETMSKARNQQKDLCPRESNHNIFNAVGHFMDCD